jgi:polar amino acid transport system substrate-binding protein
MYKFCLMGCVFLIITLSTPIQACSKAMKMALENWPPYVFVDAKGQAAGLDIELAQAVFKEAGCTLIILAELPRKRRLNMFMKGHLDLMLAASDTPERRSFSWFTAPYRKESISLFTLSSQLNKYRDLTDFAMILDKKISLLVPNAGWYGEDYKAHSLGLYEANLISPFETFAQAVKMLASHRAELVLGDTAALINEAKQMNIKIQPLPMVISNDQVSFMLSKKSSTLEDIQVLNAAIARLEKRGVLAKIRKNYGL